ncbi:hypothetical protein AK812_SmicGene41235 [Symbiodinium microadriaticum]|uniref:Uncharacterized protein n=1 Tax=Symbiodinium microadriaticum TaxID=2951 RepID=A0A1Q9C6P5_SYMMI|nr:hypothetical protein AK812_SmicGene41235 [Symbiodinium microadriaticum]
MTCNHYHGLAWLNARMRGKVASQNPAPRAGPERLLVLGSEIGGRWNEAAQRLVRAIVVDSNRGGQPLLRRLRTRLSPMPVRRGEARPCLPEGKNKGNAMPCVLSQSVEGG